MRDDEISLTRVARDLVRDPNASARYVAAVKREVDRAVKAINEKIERQAKLIRATDDHCG